MFKQPPSLLSCKSFAFFSKNTGNENTIIVMTVGIAAANAHILTTSILMKVCGMKEKLILSGKEPTVARMVSAIAGPMPTMRKLMPF